MTVRRKNKTKILIIILLITLIPFKNTFSFEINSIPKKLVTSLITELAKDNSELINLGLDAFNAKINNNLSPDYLIENIDARKEKSIVTIDKLIKLQDEVEVSTSDKSKLLELINVERYHIVSYEKLLEYLKNSSIDDDYDLLYSFLINATLAKETLNYVNEIINL